MAAQNLANNIRTTIQEINLYIPFAQTLVNKSSTLLNNKSVDIKTLDENIQDCKLSHQQLVQLSTTIASYLESETLKDLSINKKLSAEAKKSQESLNRMIYNLGAHIESIEYKKKIMEKDKSSANATKTQQEVKRGPIPSTTQPTAPQPSANASGTQQEVKRGPIPSTTRPEWSCPKCTFINSDNKACEMCGSLRPAPQPAVLRATQPEVKRPEAKQLVLKPVRQPQLSQSDSKLVNVTQPTSWSCPTCTFDNAIERKECEICQTKKPTQPTRPTRPTHNAQPAPEHKQTKIIRINPQLVDSICTPASFIIAMLILQDINLLDNVKLVNILHDNTGFNPANAVKTMISEIKFGAPAYSIDDLNRRITELSKTTPFNNMEILCDINEGSAGGVDCEGKDHNAIFKQIFVGLLTRMPVNSVMSFIYAGTGCAFVRVSDKYIYVDTHVHASEYKNGSKGYIISAQNVDELLNNMGQIISMCVEKYKAVFATNIEDIRRLTDSTQRQDRLFERIIMQQYSYCIYKFKQPSQRGGYMTKKQDWFKIKYM
jgi:hypothetical protein